MASATTEDAPTPMEIDGDATEEEEKSLLIPITSSLNTELTLEIFRDELPAVTVLQQVLVDEKSSTSTWLDAAVFYLQTSKPNDALQLLQQAPPPSNKTDQVRWHASTGICHWALGDFAQADEGFTAAGKLDTFFPMTWIGRGLLNWSRGKPDQAKFFFQTTLKQCGNVLPALLGMAAVLYNQGDYVQAQAFYEKVLREHGGDANTRVGFGLCCYQQGQVDRAKAAFARALDMDPENVQAMVAQAVLDMAAVDETAKDFSARIERAIKLMSMANLLDHSNAMVQNHLANHYFWKWTPVPGTVQVTKGSTEVRSSQPIPLDAGEPVRIGTTLETTVAEEDPDDASRFQLATPWTEESTEGLKVWKKDYERVFALAKGAYNSTKVASIQAESLFFLARVYHVRQDIDNAYKFYKKACELAPDLTPARFGLSQTLVVRGQPKEAAQELQDFLGKAPNPKPTDALALLGLLQAPKLMTMESPPALRQARELDPLNPELLVLEAMALQSRSPAKSLQKYRSAVQLVQQRGDAAIPVEWYNNMGVLCHETRQWEAAKQYYTDGLQSLVTNNKDVLQPTSKGLEGGTLRQPDNDIFWGFVETPVSVVPVITEVGTGDDKDNENKDDEDEKSKKKTKCVKVVSDPTAAKEWIIDGEMVRLGETFSTRVVGTKEKDGDLLIELAEAWEQQDDKENKQEVKTFTVYCQRENTLLDLPEATTLAFNIARLHEATGRPLAAVEIHRAITKRNPAYVNSYLRLACIAVDSGALKECSEWLKIAAASSPGNSEVLTLIGNLHLSLCDWKPAQDVFEGLMGKKIPQVEAYANLSMGNIYFETLSISSDRYTKHLEYAAGYYQRILGKDPLNAYAANGLGTVLAERGEIFKAKEVFNRVREVSEDSIADALLNLGHIYLAQKKHPEALQMYQNYMKRVEDVSTPTTSKSRVEDLVDVLLYIAFAYFDWARHTELFNDANAAPADGRYKKAMEYITMALGKQVAKKEVVLKYNLCMIKLQAANCVLQKLTRNITRTVEEVEQALIGLEESQSAVEHILEEKQTKGEGGAKKIPIKTATLEDFLKHCRANIASAQSHLEDERKRAQEESQEREIRRLAAETALKEEELKATIAKEEQAKEQEERDRKADEKMRKVEELRQRWEQAQAQEAAQKEKKAKKKSAEDDFIVEENPASSGHGLFGDSDDDEDEVKDNENSKETGEAKTKPSSADLFGDSDDEDEDNGEAAEKTSKESSSSPKKLAKKNDGPVSDDEEFGEAAPEKPASSKDLFGDSDEDEESDEELIKSDSKREGDKSEGDQPKKKRRVLEEEE